jgi:hypothetical protein
MHLSVLLFDLGKLSPTYIFLDLSGLTETNFDSIFFHVKNFKGAQVI